MKRCDPPDRWQPTFPLFLRRVRIVGSQRAAIVPGESFSLKNPVGRVTQCTAASGPFPRSRCPPQNDLVAASSSAPCRFCRVPRVPGGRKAEAGLPGNCGRRDRSIRSRSGPAGPGETAAGCHRAQAGSMVPDVESDRNDPGDLETPRDAGWSFPAIRAVFAGVARTIRRGPGMLKSRCRESWATVISRSELHGTSSSPPSGQGQGQGQGQSDHRAPSLTTPVFAGITCRSTFFPPTSPSLHPSLP